MKTDQKVTPEFISKLSYTDFIGFVNQWNVLPGAHSTLSKWAVYSQMDSSSRLLEVACSTGFSSREIASLTGCSGEGFDLSERSIEMAKYNKEKYSPKIDFSYKVADGYEYESTEKFSHIAVGASLKFFPDPQKMLGRCIDMLDDNGFLLAAPFYVTKEIPDELVNRFQKIFDITPTNASYKEIMSLYNKLEIIYEDRNELVKESQDELEHYCHSTVKRACEIRDIENKEVYQAMFDKLFEVKKMSNDLRPYQEYSVLVLRYRKSVYPNRFVELF